MPEGHTIHRLAARHQTMFAGAPVAVSSPQGRFAEGAATVSGRIMRGAEAYGKHLLHHYDGVSLHVHLGLYGRFTDGPHPVPTPVGEVRLRYLGAAHWLELRGPAACELLDGAGVGALLARLGEDPLRADAEPATAYDKIRRSGKPLGALLLDQSVVAGAGLIYVTEVLFRAGLPPTTPGRAITAELWAAIWADLCQLMRTGVAEGRIDTVRAEHAPAAMGRAPRVDRHGGEVYVYRRAGQPCLVCHAEVRYGQLAGRNAYWCAICQPTAVPATTPAATTPAATPGRT